MTESQEWSSDQSRALDFGSTALALQYSSHRSLQDIQVVLKFSEDRYDVRIPLADSCRDQPAAQR